MFKKFLANIQKEPYMRMKIHYRNDGSIGFTADWNKYFIEQIDDNYYKAANTEYNPMWTDNEKLAFYLAASFDAILGTHESLDELQEIADEYQANPDPYGNVPMIGTVPVTQTVDIAKMDRGQR